MTFLAGRWLWLLLVLAALAVAYAVLQLRRRRYAVRFTNLDLLDVVAPRRPGWRRHLPAALFLLAAASLVTALARPARDERVPRERATIVLAIDTSLSMEATDVEPSRLEAAQEAANTFLDLVPDTLNVGLVTFDGVARVEVVPTTDRAALRRAIDDLELGESTAIGEAIFASLDAIESVPGADGADDGAGGSSPDGEGDEGQTNGEPVPARVVLMSDGETTVGRPNEEGAEAAAEADVPVSTIAFGTDEGVVEIEPEPGVGPQLVPVPVAEEPLEEIADITGGSFFTAVSEDELSEVYADIGSAVGFTTEQREVTTWFLGLGVALLLATGGLSLLWFARLP